MNHSIITADRTTHMKIVAVALIAATLVAGVGIAARIADSPSGTAATSMRAQIPVITAGKPVAVSRSTTTVIR